MPLKKALAASRDDDGVVCGGDATQCYRAVMGQVLAPREQAGKQSRGTVIAAACICSCHEWLHACEWLRTLPSLPDEIQAARHVQVRARKEV